MEVRLTFKQVSVGLVRFNKTTKIYSLVLKLKVAPGVGSVKMFKSSTCVPMALRRNKKTNLNSMILAEICLIIRQSGSACQHLRQGRSPHMVASSG